VKTSALLLINQLVRSAPDKKARRRFRCCCCPSRSHTYRRIACACHRRRYAMR